MSWTSTLPLVLVHHGSDGFAAHHGRELDVAGDFDVFVQQVGGLLREFGRGQGDVLRRPKARWWPMSLARMRGIERKEDDEK